MKWWPWRRQPKYQGIRFKPLGEMLPARVWEAAGESGGLEWTARLRRVSGGVRWTLTVSGPLAEEEVHEGLAQNQYTSTNEVRAALRKAIDDYNRLSDAVG